MIENMQTYGALNYSLKDICLVENINIEDIKEEFFDKNSEMYKAYEKGEKLGKLSIESKLFNLAKNGDMDAIKLMEERKQKNDIDNLTNELFGI